MNKPYDSSDPHPESVLFRFRNKEERRAFLGLIVDNLQDEVTPHWSHIAWFACDDVLDTNVIDIEITGGEDDPAADFPYGGSHAPDCPYRLGGECLCWRSDPEQNPDAATTPD